MRSPTRKHSIAPTVHFSPLLLFLVKFLHQTPKFPSYESRWLLSGDHFPRESYSSKPTSESVAVIQHNRVVGDGAGEMRMLEGGGEVEIYPGM